MNKRLYIAFVVLVLITTACQPAPPQPENMPVPTDTLVPTDTPVPTNTPEPTNTPLPTYDLSLQVLMPAEVENETSPFSEAVIKANDEIVSTNANGMLMFEGLTVDTLSLNLWAQGYLPLYLTISLVPGENEDTVKLEPDPFALQPEILEGYEIAYIEDFQDGTPDFIEGKGNFGVFEDDTNPGNYLLEVDLRNLNDGYFRGSFGEAGISDFVVQAHFRYPEIDYFDFSKDHNNWQGYGFIFREDYSVEGYPLRVPWGPTIQFSDFSEDNWQFPVTVPQYINQGDWYTLKVVANGSVVEGYINGIRRFRYLNAPDPKHNDNIWIKAFSNAWLQYDDIVLWVPVE